MNDWLPIRDADPRGFGHYMKHYSSRKARDSRPHRGRFEPNGRFYMGNGETWGLITLDGTAHFVWRRQDYRKDGQANSVECSLFRNTGILLSSELIREAVALAWERWPGFRLFTYCTATVSRAKTLIRWGECFLHAGWTLFDVRGCKFLWELRPND